MLPSRCLLPALAATACAVAAAPAGAQTVLADGHIDYAARMVDGALRSQVKDATRPPALRWHDPADVIVALSPKSRKSVPAGGGGLGFIAPPGAPLWLIPQVEEPGVIWAGWNTEELTPATGISGVTWRLLAVDGPGHLALFSTGVFGNQEVLFNTRDGLPDALNVPTGVHAHGTWAFTAAGTYRLTFEHQAHRPGQPPLTDVRTLSVDVDPSSAPGAPTPPGGGPGQDPSGAGPGTSTPGPSGSASPAAQPQRRAALRVSSARLQGRALTLRVHVDARSRVRPTVLRGSRVVSRPKAATLPRGAHTIRRRLPRALPAGRYTVRVSATANRRTVVARRTITVGRPTATARRASGVTLARGHADYGARIVGGRLRSMVKDDTRAGRAVWRAPSTVTIRVTDRARAKLPRDPKLRFLGRPGQTVWMIPQVQQRDVIWLGWNTELVSSRQVRGPVTWTLEQVRGPGRFALFQTGTFGDPDVRFRSTRLPASMRIPLGTHAHGTWAFTRRGTYRLRMTMRATSRAGRRLADRQTLKVVVG